jgi:hypothetical protein
VQLRDFLSPINHLEHGAALNQVSITSILDNTLKQFFNKQEQFYSKIQTEWCHNPDDSQDTFWKFSLCCLNLLKNLNECKFDINPNGCYLSINDERLLRSCCQLTTCFGIHYNLEDHIGVPIDKLSKYGINIIRARETITPALRNQRLLITLKYLHQIKMNPREHVDIVAGIFLRKHMHDMLTSLIQVCYSPNKSKN